MPRHRHPTHPHMRLVSRLTTTCYYQRVHSTQYTLVTVVQQSGFFMNITEVDSEENTSRYILWHYMVIVDIWKED